MSAAEQSSEPCQSPPSQPRLVAVIGLGLIGASVGLAMRRAFPSVEVVGYDVDSSAVRAAYELRAITCWRSSISDASCQADTVFLAVPRCALSEVSREVSHTLPPHAVVTDTAGTKRDVVVICERALGARFVGGHPMAGSVCRGPHGANPTLFDGAPWILTPTPSTDESALCRIKAAVTALGASPVVLSPHEHDLAIAYLSQLPHVVAYALAGIAAEHVGSALVSHAGRSFRDATRVARSDPATWADLLLANREFACQALTGLASQIIRVGDAIARGDIAGLLATLSEGHIQDNQPST